MGILFIILSAFIIGGEVEHKLEESKKGEVMEVKVKDKP